jgi:ribosomal protein S18 acetylase RimI-like enzyme
MQMGYNKSMERENMQYEIRKAQGEDLPRIEEIYAHARAFMASHGNPNQWGKRNPPTEQLQQDIRDQLLYVVECENNIHGVFFYAIGEDPTYACIENGAWHSNELYGTIHRIAGDGSGGILKAAVQYVQGLCPYIRIDTHKDNTVMQNALHKLGFRPCGIIYIADGSPRIAYDRCMEAQNENP